MTVETYWTADGTSYKVIRCRPIWRFGPGHDLPPSVQISGDDADRLSDDVGEELEGEFDERPVYVEIVTDHGRADYEVASVHRGGERYNLRRRT